MPKSHRAAFMPHSVRYSSHAFVEGPNGLPMPNVARFEASPFVAFADGEPGVSDGAPPAPPAEKTFTQAELNNIVSRETKKSEAKLKAESDAAIAAARQELEQLKIQVEEAGKSAAEKEKAASQRQLATLEAQIAELKKTAETHAAAKASAETALRDERVNNALNALLAQHKVLPTAMRFAANGFRTDAQIEFDEAGAVAAVDFDGKRFNSLADAVTEWMRANGALFIAGPGGGAGTRPSTGTMPANLADLSTDDLLKLDAQQRAVRR